MQKVIFKVEGSGDVEISAAPGDNLLELARKVNVAIDAPCSGNGSCGKCRVRILEGGSASERTRHIDEKEHEEGWRLACLTKAESDLVVEVPDIASAYKSRLKISDLSGNELEAFDHIRDELIDAGISMDSAVKSIVVSLGRPSLNETMPDNERVVKRLRNETGVQNVVMPFYILKKMPDVMRKNDFTVRFVVEYRGDALEILDILDREDRLPACGIAVDIGTTTVSAVLVDFKNGRILAKASAGNGQIRYGADVINRIVEQQKPGGADKLQSAITEDTLFPMIDAMCAEAGLPIDRVYRMAISSNTTMNHLLLGINADYLRMEPYIPAFFELRQFNTRNFGVKLSPTAVMSISPNVGSYVGGDITAGTLASMMWNSDELSLLIDLGTNGEIVFGNREFMMACACSAGPAFEGGDISCGMRATDGAVEACTINAETMEPSLSVIGGVKPVGICGSGIIDLIAELYRARIINGKGKLVKKGERVSFDDYGIGRFTVAFPEETGTNRALTISEIDIDNFIRAKGAVFSAIQTLVSTPGFAIGDIEKIRVAGGIGSGINIKNAISIGMFPDIPADRYEYIGNASLLGSYAMLMSRSAARKIRGISRTTVYVELSTEPGYMDSFVSACFLPHTDAKLFQSGRGI